MKSSTDESIASNPPGWPLLHLFRRALLGPAEVGVSGPRARMSVPMELALDGLRVLVADDNPVNLMVASEMLAQFGIEPLLAADGAEAVALAADLRIDLILMDLQMPVLDGLRATRQIRRLEQEQARERVPVVAYTSLNGRWAQLRDHGFDDALDKPCEVLAMRDCLLHWCRPRDGGAQRAALAAQSPH